MATVTKILVVTMMAFTMGFCRGELFFNTKYNRYGTNPYLAPVFNGSSAPNPAVALPDAASTNVPIVEQENLNNNEASSIQNEVGSTEDNSPKAESTEQTPETLNDIVPPSNPQFVQPTVQPVFVYPQNPSFQNPQNVQPVGYYPSGSQASFPAPNYNQNPYLQGLLPGGGSKPQNSVPILPPSQKPVQPVSPPQNAIPQNPLPPQNPIPQNPLPLPPQNPQNPQLPQLSNNNPYLQNVNPGVQPQNPQVGGVSNQNPFFPSVPVPQAPTQNYPTPCTIPASLGTQNFVPSQGITYQPAVATIAAKHLRSRCLKPRGQFPSDKCNYFINCWDHDVREQPCPPGLAFSAKGYCDFEGNVDCNGLPMAAVSVQPGDATSPQGGVSYVSQPSFAPSVPVSAGQPAVQAAQNPQPTVPVEVSSSSLPQGNVAVTIPAALPEQNSNSILISSTAVPVPSTTVDPALKAKCLKPRGQFPTEICNRYINCWDDVVRIEECPKGMSFSDKGYCDFDFSVNCGERTYDRKVFNSTICPTPHGTFRDKLNCSQYYTCMFGEIVAKYGCPSGLSYNDVLGVCDYTEKVDCSHAPLIYPPTENHVVMQEIKEGAPNTSKCTPGSIYRLNPQCTSAVICRYGFTEVVECPPGLAYDSLTDKCLLPHLSKC